MGSRLDESARRWGCGVKEASVWVQLRGRWFSKCGPQTSDSSITWQLRRADSQALSKTSHIRNSEYRASHAYYAALHVILEEVPLEVG